MFPADAKWMVNTAVLLPSDYVMCYSNIRPAQMSEKHFFMSKHDAPNFIINFVLASCTTHDRNIKSTWAKLSPVTLSFSYSYCNMKLYLRA